LPQKVGDDFSRHLLKESSMHIAVTGATGFIGRYLVRELLAHGHTLRCWRRAASDVSGFDDVRDRVEWLEGGLGDGAASRRLVEGCDAAVHAALSRPGAGFMGAEGEILSFVETNVLGTLRLIEASRSAGAGRFVFVSTCAVHDVILDDRLLDEKHPLWPKSHYGAHKAAIEKFVHSYGLGQGYPICAVRPTGVYGINHPIEDSKWFDLVRSFVRGETVTCQRGGKEVHAADVAKAVRLLLDAPEQAVTGQAFNCYDLYVSQWDVAQLAKKFSGSDATIQGGQTTPKNQIETGKIRSLGMTFGGREQLERTIRQMVEAIREKLAAG
jgi:nucleoside-diphosphate-sugar epimerase